MVTVKIVCVGSIKENYYTEAIQEYVKRISRYAKLKIVEVSETPLPKNASKANIEQVRISESLKLQKLFEGHVILLEVHGKQLSSEQLAVKLEKLTLSASTITFVIGGSHGVSQELKKQVADKLSFSKFTLPHQLIRVVLCEQVYRAFTINNNVTYHK